MPSTAAWSPAAHRDLALVLSIAQPAPYLDAGTSNRQYFRIRRIWAAEECEQITLDGAAGA
jgi:hypothetical protein